MAIWSYVRLAGSTAPNALEMNAAVEFMRLANDAVAIIEGANIPKKRSKELLAAVGLERKTFWNAARASFDSMYEVHIREFMHDTLEAFEKDGKVTGEDGTVSVIDLTRHEGVLSSKRLLEMGCLADPGAKVSASEGFINATSHRGMGCFVLSKLVLTNMCPSVAAVYDVEPATDSALQAAEAFMDCPWLATHSADVADKFVKALRAPILKLKRDRSNTITTQALALVESCLEGGADVKSRLQRCWPSRTCHRFFRNTVRPRLEVPESGRLDKPVYLRHDTFWGVHSS